jgi:hypothetical protein
MYSTVLMVHSWLRWFTLVMAFGATLNALRPIPVDATRPPGRWWDTFLMLAVDLQMLAGLVLYFGLSPATQTAMTNVGAAFRVPTLRYWSIEHAGAMFGALVLVRAGRVMAMHAPNPEAGRRRRLICFGVALVAMLAAIPWPWLAAVGRPLFRWPA